MTDDAEAPLRVLLVDDNPDDRRLAQLSIQREFPMVHIMEATDEASFAAALDGGKFDVVITDYRLGWSDGLSVLRAVKERWSDIPVLMFTASGSEEIAVEAVRSGLDDYVLKGPARARRLPSAIRAALEHVRQKQALAGSEARKGAMLQAAIDAVIAIDKAGYITEFNPAAERMFGYRRDAALGKELASLLIPDDLRDRHRAGLARYLDSGISTIIGRRIELRGLRADGQEFPVELAINRVQLPGSPMFIGYVRDISEHKRLEESLVQSQKIEAIGQLAGGVAHDFNNMLTVIAGFSTLLLEDLVPGDPSRQLVEEIQRATGRAETLTRQLLAFSRRQVLRPEALDLTKLVTDLQPLLRRVVPEDIVTNVNATATPVVVDVDRAQFEQVLLNLVVNARDAMPAGGTLTIETALVDVSSLHADEVDGDGVDGDGVHAVTGASAPAARQAMLAVTDTGIGMDETTQARIFEPFFTTKDVGKGTGLGLAMCYGTVRQSGGNIWVSSAPGQGATFRILLPVSSATPAPSQAETGSTPRRLRPGTTVLLIEDDEQLRELMGQALEQAGCRVIAASTGSEAVAAAGSETRLDLVISDVVMPAGNGPEVVRLLRESRPGLKVLFISGYAPQFATTRGLALSSESSFLQKPFALSALVEAAQAALGG
jgi:two-component system, cell cycle sensor histidine kinase and response regulator CckA